MCIFVFANIRLLRSIFTFNVRNFLAITNMSKKKLEVIIYYIQIINGLYGKINVIVYNNIYYYLLFKYNIANINNV